MTFQCKCILALASFKPFRLRTLFFLVAAISANFASAYTVRPVEIKTAFDVFWREMQEAETADSPAERSRRIEVSYDQHIAPFKVVNPSLQTSKDLRLLLEAARAKVIYLQAEDAARFAQTIGKELLRRGELTGADADDITHFLLAARQLDAAREWKEFSHSSFAVPQVIDRRLSKVHSEWVFDETAERIISQDFIFPPGPYLIVVSHPLCQFSNNAAQAIGADPELSGPLQNKIKWLVPHQLNFDSNVFVQWNQERPGQQLSLAYLGKEWPEISSWATPTFYFFTDGKLVSSFSGWPAEGRKDELLANMRLIKLIGPSAQ